MKFKVHKRGFVSLLSLNGLLLLVLTGTVLYLVPKGSIASWLDWRLWGLSKQSWEGIHLLSSLLFVIACIFHIYYNWNALIEYIVSKMTKTLNLKFEMLISLILTLIIFLSVLFHLPPLSWVLDLNAYLQASWLKEDEGLPPFLDAEKFPLKVLTAGLNIDAADAKRVLEAKGYIVHSIERELCAIARDNKMSPQQMYQTIRKLNQSDPHNDFSQE